MNVSAVNCTPIKPQASFGREVDFDDVNNLYERSKERYFNDSYENYRNVHKKSITQTLASVLMAIAATYVGGKLLATKAIEIFPSLPERLSGGLKNIYHAASDKLTKIAGNQKHVKIARYADKLKNGLTTLKDKYVNEIGKNNGLNNLFKKAAGIGAVASIAPKVATVDGNNDGIADISQRGINAYKSALDDVGVLSEIVKATT